MTKKIKMEEAYNTLAWYMSCTIDELFEKYKMQRCYVDMTYLGTPKTAYECLVLTRDNWHMVAIDLKSGEIYDENLNNVKIRHIYLEEELEERHPDLYKKRLNWDERNKKKKNRIINKSKSKNYISTASIEEIKEVELWIKKRKEDLKKN